MCGYSSTKVSVFYDSKIKTFFYFNLCWKLITFASLTAWTAPHKPNPEAVLHSWWHPESFWNFEICWKLFSWKAFHTWMIHSSFTSDDLECSNLLPLTCHMKIKRRVVKYICADFTQHVVSKWIANEVVGDRIRMLQLLYHHHKNVFEIITFCTHSRAIVCEAFVLFSRCLRTSANHLFFYWRVVEIVKTIAKGQHCAVFEVFHHMFVFCKDPRGASRRVNLYLIFHLKKHVMNETRHHFLCMNFRNTMPNDCGWEKVSGSMETQRISISTIFISNSNYFWNFSQHFEAKASHSFLSYY